MKIEIYEPFFRSFQ